MTSPAAAHTGIVWPTNAIPDGEAAALEAHQHMAARRAWLWQHSPQVPDTLARLRPAAPEAE